MCISDMNWHSLDSDIIKIRQGWSSKAATLNKRAKDTGAKGKVTRVQLILLVEEYNGCCAYCGLKTTIVFEDISNWKDIDKARTLTFDHKVPIGNGGSNDIDNIVPSCYLCNHTKDDEMKDTKVKKEDK